MPNALHRLRPITKATAGLLQNSFERLAAIPRSAEKLEVGASVQGREIACYRVGHGPQRVLFAAAMHGNEVGTVKLAHQLLGWLCKEPKRYPHLTCFVIPCLNPDGYRQALKHPDYRHGGRVGRFNANRVDLNRNFDTTSFVSDAFWNHGLRYQEKTPVYAGEHGGSEPETWALTSFIQEQGIDVLFTLHNVGRDVMGSNSALAKRLAVLYSSWSGYHLASDEEWKAMEQTGTCREWCDEHGIAHIEVEGPHRWGSGWQEQKEALEACLLQLNEED